MDQRISVVTLGVTDVTRSRAFYEALGWTMSFTDGDIVMFQAGGLIVSIWSRAKLGPDSGVADKGGWGGVTLGHAVADPAEVDRILDDAEAAGATITRKGGDKAFGYSGVFTDPDGHSWEVAFIEALVLHDDGTVALPS
jgi:predicted lactoylglutathione lyase